MAQQCKGNMKSCLHLLLSLVFLINNVSSHSIIKTLPGYPGILPFKLETGYIGVGENDEVQLFYYFIESERDPDKDPLLLWLAGGPGCSGFTALVYEIGPLAFEALYDGSFPSLIINPYSWTKFASIIFIDSPAGTGFSYANTSEGYNNSDTKSTKQNYMFLRKWLLKHPRFAKNPLYIAGDSFGGKIAPMVALEIAKGNEAGVEPQLLLQGYIIGNPLTDRYIDDNERVPYAHRMGLVSDQYFELAKRSCGGQYVNPNPNNVECLAALQLVQKCTDPINIWNILGANCDFVALKSDGFQSGQPRFLEDDPVDRILLSKQDEYPYICHTYNYVSSNVWANDQTVQGALHIRKGTITDWQRCSDSISYEYDVQSVIKHHQLLSDKGFQALAYSGDHDMVVPYLSTLKWIEGLNVTLDDDWRPWIVEDQVAGYTMKYKNNQAYITFATVKGAGHIAPEFYPKECFAMFERWLSTYQL